MKRLKKEKNIMDNVLITWGMLISYLQESRMINNRDLQLKPVYIRK